MPKRFDSISARTFRWFSSDVENIRVCDIGYIRSVDNHRNDDRIVWTRSINGKERRLDEDLNTYLPNGFDVQCAIGGIGKQLADIDERQIVECIVPQRNDDRHGSRS